MKTTIWNFRTLVCLLTAIGLAVGLSGCAAIFNGTKETISVNSEQQDAKLYVDGRYAGQGQGRMTISKKGTVTITAKKEGCQSHSVQVQRQFDPVTLLGLFLDGGIFSILLVDGAFTGAWSKAVQTHYTLSPQCSDDG